MTLYITSLALSRRCHSVTPGLKTTLYTLENNWISAYWRYRKVMEGGESGYDS